jgi:predicted kinase
VTPRLIVFAGLPGVGKSTLARALAARLRAVYLRVDTIEQALKDSGAAEIGPAGYLIGYALAAENLRLGRTVIADAVNPIQASRMAWREVAAKAPVPLIEVEVVCGDAEEHRLRVETRSVDVMGLALPLWDQVVSRHYEAWDRPVLRLDTAGRDPATSLAELVTLIDGEIGPDPIRNAG